MNEEIRDREVRVIDQNGEQLGVQPIRKALELAEEAGLDLVKIVPTAKPPVCKLMDYDKYRYEQAKKEREIRRNQKVVSIKEVQLSATIEENDIQTKAKAAVKFLQGGDKVKVFDPLPRQADHPSGDRSGGDAGFRHAGQGRCHCGTQAPRRGAPHDHDSGSEGPQQRSQAGSERIKIRRGGFPLCLSRKLIAAPPSASP